MIDVNSSKTSANFTNFITLLDMLNILQVVSVYGVIQVVVKYTTIYTIYGYIYVDIYIYIAGWKLPVKIFIVPVGRSVAAQSRACNIVRRDTDHNVAITNSSSGDLMHTYTCQRRLSMMIPGTYVCNSYSLMCDSNMDWP